MDPTLLGRTSWCPPVPRNMVTQVSNDDDKVVRNLETLLGFFLGGGVKDSNLPSPLAFKPSPGLW